MVCLGHGVGSYHMCEQIKRLVSIWKLLATKSQLSEFVEPQDIEVFQRRALAEGLPFLTVTLPRLFKSLDRALSTFQLEEIEGWKRKKGCSYPIMLNKAWETLFTEEGILRFEARQCSPEFLKESEEYRQLHASLAGAVACIRQLSAIFYKLELPYTDDQESDCIKAFLNAEDDLRQLDTSKWSKLPLLIRARRILAWLLAGIDPTDIRPKHGSGASACKLKPYERYESFRFIPRLHEVFPQDSYFFYSLSHFVEIQDVFLAAGECDPMARVVFVPKDSRGPRLISCEPREFMFIQQGLWSKLNDVVRSRPAIAAQVGFTDQTRNQRMAYEGSIDPSKYATLDLKEASDRVSLELVETLFPENWVRALRASRSLGTILPDGTKVPLAKFAPMGSACCFPIEALCFWSIGLAAMQADRDYLRRLFRNALHSDEDVSISVFGDDIIVPTHESGRVMAALESVGLLVNRDKSYWTGSFRESCGGDFFQGVNVTPVRVKALPLNDNQSRNRMCNLMNNLIATYGADGVIEYYIHELMSSWYGAIPISPNYEKVLPFDVRKDEFGDRVQMVRLHDGVTLYGRYLDVHPRYKRRYNKCLHRREFKVLVCRSVHVNVNCDSWGSVMRRELQQLKEQTADRCALAKRTRIKYSWTTL